MEIEQPINDKISELEKDIKELEDDNNRLNGLYQDEHCTVLELEQENERLKKELQIFKDMAKKGLEEFKDVGGCWGCGIQLSLNQSWADCTKYKQALQEIKEMALRGFAVCDDDCGNAIRYTQILDIINKAEV